MSTVILLVFFFLFIPRLEAETFFAHLIGSEKINTQITLLKFSNGRVALTNDVLHLETNDPYAVIVDENQNLLQIQSDNKALPLDSEPPHHFHMSPPPTPTLISAPQAYDIFNRLNSRYKRSSECSNRAHIWAWEEFTKHQMTSEKVYVLFTASYINKHRFKWWFHVAPLFSIKKDNNVEKWVFDFMFNPRPVTIKEWTDGFVFTKRPCLYTEKFSEYDVNPQTEDCYLMIDSMFTWNPIDLKNKELSGQSKSQFSRGEINFAYKQAF